jgi:hypothetical protein
MVRSTSIAVYHQLIASGLIKGLQDQVLHDIAYNGPVTAGETFKRLTANKPPSFNDSFHQRFDDLRKKGLIEIVGERQCTVANFPCQEWDLTGRTVPLPKEKKPTRVEAERDACYRIALEVAAIAKTEQGKRAAEEVASRILARGKKP